MYRITLILCAIFSLAFAFRLPPALRDHNHLVGGRDPKAGEVKYIVGIRTYQFTCGGGIIGEKFILTAAHCVKVDPDTQKFLPPFRILAGTNVMRGHNRAETIVIDVEEAYLPSVYVRDGPDDIAVLKLKKPLDLVKNHDKVRKLSLPEPLTKDPLTYPTYENIHVKFAGYGNTQADIVNLNGKVTINRSGAGHLQVADALITDADTCKKHFNTTMENEMCLSVVEDPTKSRQQGTCKGDSGSPAVYNNNVVVGLDSKGIWCDNNKAPSLFTRVSAYIPFILQAMSGNSSGLVVYTE